MLIDLSSLGGGSKKVETLVDAKDLDLGLEHARLTAPVLFSGEVTGDSLRAKVSGSISAEFQIGCTRCLDPVEIALPLEFSSEFVAKDRFGFEGEHEIDQQNLSTSALQEDRIDMNEIVREQLLLNVPEQIFCREGCRGLCETCGVNRNYQDCDCAEVAIDPRWSVLKNLK